MTELARLDASRSCRTRWMSREATVEKAIETDVIRPLTRRAGTRVAQRRATSRCRQLPILQR